MTYNFSAQLWLWTGKDSWCFASVPNRYFQEIKKNIILKRGFGSVKVEVTIGTSTWKTSIFPDNKSSTYLLPIKKAIREKEGLKPGDTTSIVLTLIDT